MKLLTLCVLAVSTLTLGGCASMRAPVKLHPIEDPSKPHWVEVDASRRGVLIVPRPDGKGFLTCSEPSPDIALSVVATLIAEVKLTNPNIDAKTQLEFSQAVIDLSKRSQTLLFLRESMLRLCEQSLNQNLSSDQVMTLYQEAMKTALKMAEAELTKQQADLAKQLQNPAVRDLWNQTFGVPAQDTAATPLRPDKK